MVWQPLAQPFVPSIGRALDGGQAYQQNALLMALRQREAQQQDAFQAAAPGLLGGLAGANEARRGNILAKLAGLGDRGIAMAAPLMQQEAERQATREALAAAGFGPAGAAVPAVTAQPVVAGAGDAPPSAAPAAHGSAGPAPAATPGDAHRTAYQFFVQQGWAPHQAAAIVANLHAESGFRTDAAGDGGRSRGVAQWNGSRRQDFIDFVGVPPERATLQQQLAFIQHEMTAGNERAAGERLRAARDAAEAGGIVSRYYERPRDVEREASVRGALAARFHAQFGGGGAAPASPSTQAGGDPSQAPAAPAAPAGNPQRAAQIAALERQRRALIATGNPRAQVAAQAVGEEIAALRREDAQDEQREFQRAQLIEQQRARVEAAAAQRQAGKVQQDIARRDRDAQQPLVSIIDPTTGKPRLVTREEARGQQPAPTPPSTVIEQRGPNAFEAEVGQLEGRAVAAMTESGTRATEQMHRLAEIERALTTFSTGAGAEARVQVGRVAQALGIPDEALARFGLTRDSVASAEQIRAVSANLVLGMIGSGGMPANNFSDADRRYLAEANPSLAQTPEGNRRLVAIARAGTMRQLELSRAWDEYSGRHGVSQQSWRDFNRTVRPQIIGRDIIAPMVDAIAVPGAQVPAPAGAGGVVTPTAAPPSGATPGPTPGTVAEPPEPAAPAAAARPRARNPQTGQVVEFDGRAWVPVR